MCDILHKMNAPEFLDGAEQRMLSMSFFFFYVIH